jgi:tetratricopeptide (TPR) repeat protein
LSRGRYAEALAAFEAVSREPRSRDSTQARVLVGVARARLGDLEGAEAAYAQAATDIENGGEQSLMPSLLLSRGELALERGDRAAALALFSRAAAVQDDELWTSGAVAAAAHRDFLTADTRSLERTRALLGVSMARAVGLKRVDVQTLCRTLEARLLLDGGDSNGAAAILQKGLPPSGVEPELAARVHSLRAEVFAGGRDPIQEASARAEAGRLVAGLMQDVPEPARRRFAARPGIAALIRVSSKGR